MEHKICCKECGSKNVVKKGKRKNKYEALQKYFCNNCSRYFTLKKLERKVYPAKVIIQAISYYNLGYSLEESSKLINKKFKVKVSSRIISDWLHEFNEICSYYRIRKRAVKLFKPKDIVFKKIFRHLQLYKYRYHKAKIEFFVSEYFNGLKDYLINISKKCPNELFRDSIRSSNINLDIDVSKIKVFKKENYACKRSGDATLVQQFIYKKYRLYIPLDTFGKYSFRKLLSSLMKKSYLIAKIEELKR